MKKKLLLSAVLFFVAIFTLTNKAQAEITTPLYTVDYKSQVLFGDSITVGDYLGLENYFTEYVGGYLRMTFTLSHASGFYASYPTLLYIRSGDPSLQSTSGLYTGLIQKITDNQFNPTNFYFVDIQFSSSGYREVVTTGPSHTPFSDDTVAVDNMDGNTFIALANQYPLSNPRSANSMSFQPMRLVSVAPSKIISFNISTSTNTASIHAYISSDDVGASINFNISTGTQIYSTSISATTTGDFYYSWIYPDPTSGSATEFNDYIFYSNIEKSGTVIQSASIAINLPTAGYPNYANLVSDTSERISSFIKLIQTLGTNLSGTLTRIDVQTSNPGFDYYGSAPILTLYECDNDNYGSALFDAIGCNVLFSGTSMSMSQFATSTQSFYVDSVVLNPTKYYFFRTYGNNPFNALPYYYGSKADTVDGSCFVQNVIDIYPCATISDLYFNLHGISKLSEPPAAGFSNVLFLPGVEASRLYVPNATRGSLENKLWEPLGDSDVKQLYMNPDGKSIETDVYTRDVVGEAYGLLNIYKSFLDKLEEMKTVDKSIADYSAVPYDWRLSLEDILASGAKDGNGNVSYLKATSSPYIIQELRRLTRSSKSGKVTIIAHSNGGLLTKALLKHLEDSGDPLLSKIDKVILVAVPQLGTPQAIVAALHGMDQGIPSFRPFLLTEPVARGLAQNAPMTYNLLPDEKYFGSVSTPVVNFDASLTDWVLRYGNSINSVSSLNNFLTDTYGRVAATSTNVKAPGTLNSLLLSRAQNMHAKLDNWNLPVGIKIIEIAGWGIPTTVSGVNYTSEHGSITPNPVWTIDGDGTVVTLSALFVNGTNVERYWMDLRKYNKEHPISTLLGLFGLDHKNITEVTELDNFISDIIASSTKSLDAYKYLSTSVPTADVNDNRLIYTLHSPLTLDLYDNQGNHTGISTTTGQIEEQISGTYFVKFGDTKYIFTGADIESHIIMKGYANGTFTFNINQLQGDNLMASTTFKDIPTTANTKVNLDISGDISTVSAMKVDENGDGVTDINLKPKLNGTVTMPTPLTVTAQNKSVILGDAILPLTYTLSGFINGDTATTSDVIGSPDCSTIATTTSPVGSYPITCSLGTLSSDNYNFVTFTPAKLSITYRFDGFLKPINNIEHDTAHHTSHNLNIFKTGSTIPVKFQLKKSDSTLIQSTTSPIWIIPQKGNQINALVDESVYSDTTTGGTVYKWDALNQQYIYNWNTKGLSAGYWYRIGVQLDDGKTYFVTIGLK